MDELSLLERFEPYKVEVTDEAYQGNPIAKAVLSSYKILQQTPFNTHSNMMFDSALEAWLLERGFKHSRTNERNLILEEAATACLEATLPSGYVYGHDAMELFNFGKERGATAIRALKKS